jgi:aconitate hydratase
MGILPLTFINDESASTHGLDGTEKVTINLDFENLKPSQEVEVSLSNGKKFLVRSSLKTDVELNYFRHGGILPFVLRLQLK